MALTDALSALVLLNRLNSSLSSLISIEKSRFEVEKSALELLNLSFKLLCMSMNLSPDSVRDATYSPDGTEPRASTSQGDISLPTHSQMAHWDELKRHAEELGVKVSDDADLEALFGEKPGEEDLPR